MVIQGCLIGNTDVHLHNRERKEQTYQSSTVESFFVAGKQVLFLSASSVIFDFDWQQSNQQSPEQDVVKHDVDRKPGGGGNGLEWLQVMPFRQLHHPQWVGGIIPWFWENVEGIFYNQS